jgi:hypothetical protein
LNKWNLKKISQQLFLNKKKHLINLSYLLYLNNQVEEALNDENSSIQLSQAKMAELKIFKGDAVFIKGKKRK